MSPVGKMSNALKLSNHILEFSRTYSNSNIVVLASIPVSNYLKCIHIIGIRRHFWWRNIFPEIKNQKFDKTGPFQEKSVSNVSLRKEVMPESKKKIQILCSTHLMRILTLSSPIVSLTCFNTDSWSSEGWTRWLTTASAFPGTTLSLKPALRMVTAVVVLCVASVTFQIKCH